jgi:hypothetical protein
MMDIIYANRRFDLGLLLDLGGISEVFSSAMTQNNLNIMSNLERAEPRVIRDIERLIDSYENIIH